MSRNYTELPNGLRVVSHHMPHLETISMGVWIGVGARHETINEQGISHLLEHMAFKGTETRSAKDIAEQIEAVGAELNAATSLEMTSYFSRALAGDVRLALDILADILQRPRHQQEELEREREVILQEIAATRDSPDEIAYELLQEASFPDQADRPAHPRHDQEREGIPAGGSARVRRLQLRGQAHDPFSGRQDRSRCVGAPR